MFFIISVFQIQNLNLYTREKNDTFFESVKVCVRLFLFSLFGRFGFYMHNNIYDCRELVFYPVLDIIGN